MLDFALCSLNLSLHGFSATIVNIADMRKSELLGHQCRLSVIRLLKLVLHCLALGWREGRRWVERGR